MRIHVLNGMTPKVMHKLPGLDRHLPSRIGQREMHQRQLRLAVLALCTLIRFAQRRHMIWCRIRVAVRRLPIRIAMLAHIHLGKRAHIPDTNHGNGENPEEVDQIESTRSHMEHQHVRSGQWAEQFVEQIDEAELEELTELLANAMGMGESSPRNRQIVCVGEDGGHQLFGAPDEVFVGYEDSVVVIVRL